MHTCCIKGMEDLDRCHQEQQLSMQEELKKEIALLQKKILMDSVRLGTDIKLLPYCNPIFFSFSLSLLTAT